MKKFICALSMSLISLAALASCGNEPNPVILDDDGEGGIVYRETEPASTLPKVKAENSSSGISDIAETTVTAEAEKPVQNNDNTKNSESTDESGTDESSTDKVDTDKTGSSESGGTSTKAVSSKPTENKTEPEELYYLEGIVYETEDKQILLDETDLNLVYVSFKDKLKDVNTGDRVLVTYDGYISESYPAQAQAYSIEVTEKADTGYTLQKFVCDNQEYNLKFSLLVPDNWTAKVIEYPTEGDFTDWGIRFLPKNGSVGIDVSWHSAFAIREPYDTRPAEVNGFKADRYTKEGYMRFYVYDNNYIVSNNFYGTEQYDEYIDTVEFMISTLDFECV